MATVIFGSARHDEKGGLTGGKAGDQTGQEVSTQTYYNHSKGWYGLRLKNPTLAVKLAQAMLSACNNSNIGYDQSNRLAIIKDGIYSKVPTEADCSSLVRACLSVCGITVTNFTTANEKSVLLTTGLFDLVTINKAADCYTGDILVTKTKGHTGIIVSGKPRDIAVGYSQDNFIADVMAILKTPTRLEALAKTPTISAKTNKNNALVTPLERYMKSLGFYTGSIEADNGKSPAFGPGMTAAVKTYQKNIVKATVKNQDGIISAHGATWKKLLNV